MPAPVLFTKKQKLGPWQEAWVQTLESGMFDQAEYLCVRDKDDNFSFSCLGIACEVAIDNGINIRYKALQISKFGDSYEGQCANLPWEVSSLFNVEPNGLVMFSDDEADTTDDGPNWKAAYKWLKQHGISRPVKDTQLSLEYLNDKKVPFEIIAEFMRTFPHGLFTWSA